MMTEEAEAPPIIIQPSADEAPAPDEIDGEDFKAQFRHLLSMLNVPRARRLMFVHAVVVALYTILTVVGSTQVKQMFTHSFFKNAAVGLTYVASVLGVGSVVIGGHFLWKIKDLSHPCATFLVFRIFLTLQMGTCFVAAAILPIVLSIRRFTWGTTYNNVMVMKSLYGLVLVLSIAEAIICYIFVAGPVAAKTFHCCCPWLCVYRPGENPFAVSGGSTVRRTTKKEVSRTTSAGAVVEIPLT